MKKFLVAMFMSLVIAATVKADIDTSDVETFLQKDAEEISKIVAGERLIRRQEEQQDQRIDALKQEYLQAATAEEKKVSPNKSSRRIKFFCRM